MAAYICDISDITIILVVRRHIVVILLLFNIRLLFARFFLYTKHSRDVLLLSLCTSELLIHNFIGLSSAPKMLCHSIQQVVVAGKRRVHTWGGGRGERRGPERGPCTPCKVEEEPEAPAILLCCDSIPDLVEAGQRIAGCIAIVGGS